MNEKELRIPFNAPFNEVNTELPIYGCRQNNPNICGNNGLAGVCAFVSRDESVVSHLVHGRSSTKSSRVKLLNSCFVYFLKFENSTCYKDNL